MQAVLYCKVRYLDSRKVWSFTCLIGTVEQTKELQTTIMNTGNPTVLFTVHTDNENQHSISDTVYTGRHVIQYSIHCLITAHLNDMAQLYLLPTVHL